MLRGSSLVACPIQIGIAGIGKMGASSRSGSSYVGTQVTVWKPPAERLKAALPRLAPRCATPPPTAAKAGVHHYTLTYAAAIARFYGAHRGFLAVHVAFKLFIE